MSAEMETGKGDVLDAVGKAALLATLLCFSLFSHRSHPHDLPLGSDLSHSIVTVISGEEHFEDYGEGNEADLFSDSLCNGESSFNSSSFLSPR